MYKYLFMFVYSYLPPYRQHVQTNMQKVQPNYWPSSTSNGRSAILKVEIPKTLLPNIMLCKPLGNITWPRRRNVHYARFVDAWIGRRCLNRISFFQN